MLVFVYDTNSKPMLPKLLANLPLSVCALYVFRVTSQPVAMASMIARRRSDRRLPPARRLTAAWTPYRPSLTSTSTGFVFQCLHNKKCHDFIMNCFVCPMFFVSSGVFVSCSCWESGTAIHSSSTRCSWTPAPTSCSAKPTISTASSSRDPRMTFTSVSS